MRLVTYYLLPVEDGNVIIHYDTGLKINVFNLKNEDFKPNPLELHVYGVNNSDWLAFETEGWTTESLRIIGQAVLWYTLEMNLSEIRLTVMHPDSQKDLRENKSTTKSITARFCHWLRLNANLCRREADGN
jgi:hypothetical protein